MEGAVVRTWKRDNTINLMPMDAAVANIEHNGSWATGKRMYLTAGQIKRSLLHNEVVETRLAMFCLASTL